MELKPLCPQHPALQEAYTGERNPPGGGALEFMLSPVVNRKRILVGLVAGFALVMLLLSVAAVVTIRRAQSIHATAAIALSDHLSTARVIDRFQVQQERMGKLLWDLLDTEVFEPDLARRIDVLRREFESITDADRREQPRLSQLRKVGLDFTADAARLFRTPLAAREPVARALEAHFDQFTALATQVVRTQAASSVALERQIQDQSAELGTESLWLLGACLALALAGAVATISVTARSFRLMRWQSEELNRVSWHMLESQEEAARRFSHEMHDELGQSLAGVKAMVRGMPGDERRREDCLRLLDEAIGNVRELSQLLRPVVLDDFGLEAALGWLAERFEERTRITVAYESRLNQRLPEQTETHLFRIAQEALTNIARHSQASKTSIALRQENSRVSLIIEDNGIGLPRQEQNGPPSLGMVGMRARARQVGGELRVEQGDGGGVRIAVWAPIDPAYSHAYQEDANTTRG